MSADRIHQNRNLCCVGGQKYVSFIDERIGKIVKYIKSHDEEWGVRSIAFNADLVSIGGGNNNNNITLLM